MKTEKKIRGHRRMEASLKAALNCQYLAPESDLSYRTLRSEHQLDVDHQIKEKQLSLRIITLQDINSIRVTWNRQELNSSANLCLVAEQTFEHVAARRAWRDKLAVMPNSAILSGIRKRHPASPLKANTYGCLVYYTPLCDEISDWFEYSDVPTAAVQFWAGNGRSLERHDFFEPFPRQGEDYAPTAAATARLNALHGDFLNQLIYAECREAGVFISLLPALQRNDADWICVIAVFDAVATKSSMSWADQTVSTLNDMPNRTGEMKILAETFSRVANTMRQQATVAYDPKTVAKSLDAFSSSLTDLAKIAWNPQKLAETLTKAAQASKHMSWYAKLLPEFARQLETTSTKIFNSTFSPLRLRKSISISEKLLKLSQNVAAHAAEVKYKAFKEKLLAVSNSLAEKHSQWMRFDRLRDKCFVLSDFAGRARANIDILQAYIQEFRLDIMGETEVMRLADLLRAYAAGLKDISGNKWYNFLISPLAGTADKIEKLANKVQTFCEENSELWHCLSWPASIRARAQKCCDDSNKIMQLSKTLEALPGEVMKTEDISAALRQEAATLKTLAQQFESNDDVSLDSLIKTLLQQSESADKLSTKTICSRGNISNRVPNDWMQSWDEPTSLTCILSNMTIQLNKLDGVLDTVRRKWKLIYIDNLQKFFSPEAISQLLEEIQTTRDIDSPLGRQSIQLRKIAEDLQDSSKLTEPLRAESKRLQELSESTRALAERIQPRDGTAELFDAMSAYSMELSEAIGHLTGRDLKTIAVILLESANSLQFWSKKLFSCSNALSEDFSNIDIRIGD